MPGDSPNAPARRERGFTMIEVMIALVLTAIAVIGMLALYISQTRSASYSRHTTEASALAIDKIEKLRTAVTPTSGTDTVDELGNTGGSAIFTRTWTVTTGTSYSDVLVRIQWEEEGGTKTLDLRGRINGS